MSEIQLFDNKELMPLGEYIPDLHWNQVLIPKADMTVDQITSFFKGFGIEVSVIDDLSWWNCTFENCKLTTIGYGNGLLGDGSISPSITLTFCDNPNEFWRGH